MSPKKAAAKPTQSIAELFEHAAKELERSVIEPNIAMYKPHPKQEMFHKAAGYGRLYIGGNRSGKSYGSAVEDIWYLTGTHPYKQTPKPPVRGRVVGVDYKEGIDQILVPLFKRLMTPSMLINGSWEDSYNASAHLLTLANGSTCEFMSYEQATEKFAGTSRHFIHYDEEPPKNVFDECQMRILDTEGDFWISMTPVEGMTWVHSVIYEPVVEGPDAVVISAEHDYIGQVVYNPVKEISVIEVDNRENPYLTDKGRARAMSLLDSDEDRQARQSGKFVQLSGLVFPQFRVETHVIPSFTPPTSWEWYSSVDHGWNNPTAWLWHAVSPEGDIYTFSEHYASHMTIEQHANTVNLREGLWGKIPEIRTGDPAMKQTNAITGTSVQQEYAKHDIYLALDSVPRQVEVGIAIMQQYFRIHPVTKKPKWFITDNCVNLISELKKLRWKKYASKKQDYENNKREEVHKKDDHAFDSARYFSTFLPLLNMDDYVDPQEPPSPQDEKAKRERLDYAGAMLRAIDEGNPSDTDWEIYQGIDLSDQFS